MRIKKNKGVGKMKPEIKEMYVVKDKQNGDTSGLCNSMEDAEKEKTCFVWQGVPTEIVTVKVKILKSGWKRIN